MGAYRDGYGEGTDYGTKIRFKCHKPIQRKNQTLEAELCTNWDFIDSFGVGLDSWSFNRFFYADNLYMPYKVHAWLTKYASVDHRSYYGENGFILKNGTFERFEPIGITWNDSYCRRITETGPSGCFVERDLSAIPDFNYQENNCTGKDSTNLPRPVGILHMKFSNIFRNESRKSAEQVLCI